METETKEAYEARRWVLNKIQTNRTLNTRGGKLVATFYFVHKEDIPEIPPIRAQGLIIQSLSDEGVIKIIKTNQDNLVFKDTNIKAKFPESFNIQQHTNNDILPSSIIISINEKKFNALLSKYNIIADKKCVNYYFNPNELTGKLVIGEKSPILFSKTPSILMHYFYENKELKNNYSDYKTFKKYLTTNNYQLKAPDAKRFKTIIGEINLRVNKKIRNISEIITKKNPNKENERNKYKWNIIFENI